jgi:hypothetical protein
MLYATYWDNRCYINRNAGRCQNWDNGSYKRLDDWHYINSDPGRYINWDNGRCINWGAGRYIIWYAGRYIKRDDVQFINWGVGGYKNWNTGVSWNNSQVEEGATLLIRFRQLVSRSDQLTNRYNICRYPMDRSLDVGNKIKVNINYHYPKVWKNKN